MSARPSSPEGKALSKSGTTEIEQPYDEIETMKPSPTPNLIPFVLAAAVSVVPVDSWAEEEPFTIPSSRVSVGAGVRSATWATFESELSLGVLTALRTSPERRYLNLFIVAEMGYSMVADGGEDNQFGVAGIRVVGGHSNRHPLFGGCAYAVVGGTGERAGWGFRVGFIFSMWVGVVSLEATYGWMMMNYADDELVHTGRLVVSADIIAIITQVPEALAAAYQ